jgi:hypothetical protein
MKSRITRRKNLYKKETDQMISGGFCGGRMLASIDGLVSNSTIEKEIILRWLDGWFVFSVFSLVSMDVRFIALSLATLGGEPILLLIYILPILLGVGITSRYSLLDALFICETFLSFLEG